MPLSELVVLLSGLLFIDVVLDRTRALGEGTERKGCREGMEKECREPRSGLKRVSLLVQASRRKQAKGGGKELGHKQYCRSAEGCDSYYPICVGRGLNIRVR